MFKKKHICWLKKEFWRYQDVRYNEKSYTGDFNLNSSKNATFIKI